MAFGLKLDSILRLPLSRKIVLLGVISLVVIGLVYWFLVGPKMDEVESLRAELSGLDEKLRENRTVAADVPRYQLEKEQMEERLTQAISRLPNEKEIPDLIDAISDAGSEAGLKILLFKPGREVPKGFYADIPVVMSVEGRFESLYDFSVRIGSLPRIVNLGSIDIFSQGHRNRVPVLKADFVATTFRFIPAQGEGVQ